MKIKYSIREFKKIKPGEYIKCNTLEKLNFAIEILKTTMIRDDSKDKNYTLDFYYENFKEKNNVWVVYEKDLSIGWLANGDEDWAEMNKYYEYKFGS